jgi:peptidoglycan pentaglycine glycine transferase (the first glycine)
MLTAMEVHDRTTWDRALLTLPWPHILQSWAWGETKAQTGWTARRLLWQIDEKPAAAAAILVRRLHPRFPLSVAYVPKGPLLDWGDSDLLEAVLSRLMSEARRVHALFVKIDPDIRADTHEGAQLISELGRLNWRLSGEQIQFRNTMLTDLTRSEDELLAGMKPKCRYNVRLAERKGVTIRHGTTADLPIFYTMYCETGQRDDFLVRPYSYYQHIWQDFLATDLAHLLLAEVEGQPIAGLIVFRFGPTAWYFYGASTANARELMPNHALQWAALRWAKAVGCSRYDWWGAPDILDESDPMWGVYRFKAAFGGEFVPGIGAWDFAVSASRYRLYTALMPKVLDLARQRHRFLTSG